MIQLLKDIIFPKAAFIRKHNEQELVIAKKYEEEHKVENDYEH